MDVVEGGEVGFFGDNDSDVNNFPWETVLMDCFTEVGAESWKSAMEDSIMTNRPPNTTKRQRLDKIIIFIFAVGEAFTSSSKLLHRRSRAQATCR